MVLPKKILIVLFILSLFIVYADDRSNVLLIEKYIRPDFPGDATLGTAKDPWGEIRIDDNKKIIFGRGENITIEYDEAGVNKLLIIGNVKLDGTLEITGAFSCTSIDTGIGAFEVYGILGDFDTTAPLTGAETDIIYGTDGIKFTLGITVDKDIVTTAPLLINAGANLDDVLTGADADVTISIDADGITDTELAFNTGQHLTTTSTPTFQQLTVTEATINTVDSYTGINAYHQKTAGVTTAADDMIGLNVIFEYDHVGSTIGKLYGAYIEAQLDDGTVGAGALDDDVWGLDVYVDLNGGATGGDVWGIQAEIDASGTAITGDIWVIDGWLDLHTGSTGDDIFGISSWMDIDAGYTSVGGDVFGLYTYVDIDINPAGDVYGCYLDENDGVDYGYYQNGTADNYFGGALNVGNVTIGIAAVGVDYTLTFDGENDDCVMTYDEGNNRLHFGDTNLYTTGGASIHNGAGLSVTEICVNLTSIDIQTLDFKAGDGAGNGNETLIHIDDNNLDIKIAAGDDITIGDTESFGNDCYLKIEGTGKKVSVIGGEAIVFHNNENAAYTLLTLRNSDEGATGETGQTADFVFEVQGTVDSGTNYTYEEGFKVSTIKTGDFWTAGGQADNDTKVEFSPVTNGAYVLAMTLEDDDLNVEGTITADQFVNSDIIIKTYQNDDIDDNEVISLPDGAIGHGMVFCGKDGVDEEGGTFGFWDDDPVIFGGTANFQEADADNKLVLNKAGGVTIIKNTMGDDYQITVTIWYYVP